LPYGINNYYNGIIGDWPRQSNRLVSCIFLRPGRFPSTHFIADNRTRRTEKTDWWRPQGRPSIVKNSGNTVSAKPSENALPETNLAAEFCGVIGVGSFFRPVVTSTKTR
jgi:hypothetical protein